ncbi:hypothetical protein BGZ76_000156 [Entomortierella beljakovae]|nr:hypothetical protein BGZ76_000156 [Entomortierella beljakovae]
MSLSALSARLFPTMRSQAMARFAAPSTSFARYYSSRKFTEEHEWVDIANGVATVGITDHAQSALGEIVYVEVPEVNKEIKLGDSIGVIESVKAASDLYAPLSGKIIEINESLAGEPSMLNEKPEDEGWICKIELSDNAQVEGLLSKEAYEKIIA